MLTFRQIQFSKMFRRVMAFLSICCLTVFCEENNHFFLTAAKSVPRIGRSPSKSGNSDFEKFFLKASKSVPRIGRGNDAPFAIDREMFAGPIKYPKWNDIAYFYEFQPELFASEDLHNNFEDHLMGDDPSVYDTENNRFKRKIPPRFQFAQRK